MSSLKSRVKKVTWRSWDVEAVEDKHKLFGPLPTAADDFKYVVDNDNSNDYGRFLRLGALINRRMDEFAGAVRESLEGMVDSNESRLDELARQMQEVQRRLDSTAHTYEQLRSVDQKLKLIESLDGRLVTVEKLVREKTTNMPGTALSSTEHAALAQLPGNLDEVRRELRDLSTRLARVESRYEGVASESLRSVSGDEPVLVSRRSSVPAWVVWMIVGVGVLVALDILSRFVH